MKQLDGLTLIELKEWLEKRGVDCLFSQHRYFKGALKLVDFQLSILDAAARTMENCKPLDE